MSHVSSISGMTLEEIQRARRVIRRSIARLSDALAAVSKKPVTVDSCNAL